MARADCTLCGGTGRILKFKPANWRTPDVGERVEVDCPYGCEKIVALVRANEQAVA
jgi:hypothetical protein